MQAVDVVIARGEVDTTKMAVLGGSYGGFMTNWIVGHTNRFRVAQTDRSIFNWYSWYGSSDAQGLTEYEFRSEEHTSELQSQSNLVCRLLLEKKKKSTHKTDCQVESSAPPPNPMRMRHNPRATSEWALRPNNRETPIQRNGAPK